MFFKISSTSVVKSVNFLEEFGTLYDLLIYLLDNSKRLLISTEAQLNFGKAITVLEIIISNPKNDIADQIDREKKEIIAEQESVLSNGKVLLEKRGKLIEQLAKNNIISKDEKFYDAPKKGEESTSEKSEQKFDQSIPKWVQVSEDRFNFIKLKININKNLVTMKTIKDIKQSKIYTK